MRNNYKAFAFHKGVTATMREACAQAVCPFSAKQPGTCRATGLPGRNIIFRTLSRWPSRQKSRSKAACSRERRGYALYDRETGQFSRFEHSAESRAVKIAFLTWTDKEPVMAANGEPELGENGKPKMQKVTLDKPVLKIGHLFHAWDVKGNDLQYGSGRSPEEKEAALDRAEALIRASGGSDCPRSQGQGRIL